MPDSSKRLIEVAFPLKQTSIDSVHEKNVRHGHISTLHIWPARRPLAACRAALIATLLPDPGDTDERNKILEKLAGKVVQKPKKKKGADGRIEEEMVEETEGGILHWGRENGPDLDWFRQKIREAYGGRAPKVLDPFAGGGAIPLEAMRLGCEATAVDINPVAWFILKCTLEYPQKLAGQKLPLPDFVRQDRDFMEAFLKAQGYKGRALQTQLDKLGIQATNAPELPGMESMALDLTADLAWHVRACGGWMLKQARRELACFYPTYADFEPLVETAGKWERRPMLLVPIDENGNLDIDSLNSEFPDSYLSNKSNPRWVAKPTVAYLWARTVTCKNCRATIPLLKTRWLCKKENKRVVLTMVHNPQKTGVIFGVQNDVPAVGKNTAERKAHDARVGGGTMSRSGVTCPCCEGIMTLEDIRLEGKAGRLETCMTAVVVDGQNGKEYHIPTENEVERSNITSDILTQVYSEIPFGLPTESTPSGGGSGAGRAFAVQGYGMYFWKDLFTPRQLFALGIFIKYLRSQNYKYSHVWEEAIKSYLIILIDKLVDRNSRQCIWISSNAEKASGSFGRFALPVTWDFVEIMPWSESAGGYSSNLDHLFEFIQHALSAAYDVTPKVYKQSATNRNAGEFDIIVTDPPYYDAIPYSDLMDFYYIWLKRASFGLYPELNTAFEKQTGPKWDHSQNDGELIDDDSRFDGNKEKSKQAYENGMARAFQMCFQSLVDTGRLVIVFANKQPDAWETLVAALIKSGFIVEGSWPIQTERSGRLRSQTSAALSSSVWLVCKKRPTIARPGWDNKVLDEMRANITAQLRDFWDAGIRGPDFVWAATGPAMEAYSQYPVVKKANEPGQSLSVAEFLTHVRRMVVDFVVGRVLTGDGGQEVSGLDNLTTYYLLHRHDFGMNDAPAGPCILYAVSCGLSDRDLADRYDLLARRGGMETEQEEDDVDEGGEPKEEGSSSVFRLKAWNQRKRLDTSVSTGRGRLAKMQLPMEFMEAEVQAGPEIPLIDQVHRLMHIWKGGDVLKVDEYLDLRGLRRNQLFNQLLQALIELAPHGSEERSLLESISNHVGGQRQRAARLL